MKRADYIEKRKQIVEEYEEKLRILDAAFVMFGGTPVKAAQPAAHGGSQSADWTHEMTKRDAVRAAVEKMTLPTFSMKNARESLRTNFADMSDGISDNQLSAILSKLAELGELVVVRKKVGKTPAVYSKPAVRHAGQTD